MQNPDYILVGQGLAGSILAWKLINFGKKVLVIDSALKQTSSQVAAGMFNPLVFRWLTKSWLIDELLPKMHDVYKEMEEQFRQQFVFYRPILKLLNEEEKAHWEKKQIKGKLAPYLDKILDTPPFEGLHEYAGFGKVNKGGFVKTGELILSIRQWLETRDAFIEADFNYAELKIKPDSVLWKNIEAQKIVFCEGAQAVNNPLFPDVKYYLTGGDILELEIENFQEEYIINKNLFLMPRGNHRYLCGSTYIHVALQYQPSEKGKVYLEKGLQKIINAPYNIIKHRTAVRPTIKDRRPVIGLHPKYKHVGYFNGLGSKGVMLAPHFAQEMLDLLETGLLPHSEVRIERFY